MMQRRGLTAWFVLVEDQRSRHGYSQDQRSVLVLPSFSCNPLFGPGCVVRQVQFRMKLLHDPTLFGNQPHPAPLHRSVYHSVYRSVIGDERISMHDDDGKVPHENRMTLIGSAMLLSPDDPGCSSSQ